VMNIFRLLSMLVALWLLTAARAQEPPPYKPAANAEEAVARIAKLGGAVRRSTQADHALEVDFQFSGDALTDAHLQDLAQLQNVVVLRLKATAVSDAGLVHVGKLTALKRLYLEKTKIGDAGLDHLAGLKELEYLNLHGTSVSDAGILRLKPYRSSGKCSSARPR
jgi:hypothetical protein